MIEYYTNSEQCKRRIGGIPSNIPKLLHQDIRLTGRTLQTYNDLLSLRNLAQNRQDWSQLTENIAAIRTRQAMMTLHNRLPIRIKRKISAIVLYHDRNGRLKRLKFTHDVLVLNLKKRPKTQNPIQEEEDDTQMEEPEVVEETRRPRKRTRGT
jgi:hypothetical protein